MRERERERVGFFYDTSIEPAVDAVKFKLIKVSSVLSKHITFHIYAYAHTHTSITSDDRHPRLLLCNWHNFIDSDTAYPFRNTHECWGHVISITSLVHSSLMFSFQSNMCALVVLVQQFEPDSFVWAHLSIFPLFFFLLHINGCACAIRKNHQIRFVYVILFSIFSLTSPSHTPPPPAF